MNNNRREKEMICFKTNFWDENKIDVTKNVFEWFENDNDKEDWDQIKKKIGLNRITFSEYKRKRK